MSPNRFEGAGAEPRLNFNSLTGPPALSVPEMINDLRGHASRMTRTPGSSAQTEEEQPLDQDEHVEESLTPDSGNHPLFLRHLIQHTPSGKGGCPSLCLEFGGGEKQRPYDPNDLSQRKTIIGNIDRFPAWGDRQLACDIETLQNGLADQRVRETLLQGVTLGSAVMGHFAKFIPSDNLASLVESILENLSAGGSITVLDTNTTDGVIASLTRKLRAASCTDELVHEFLYKRIQMACQLLQQIAQNQPERYRLQRYSLGTALPSKIVRRLRTRQLDAKETQNISEGRMGKVVLLPIEPAKADADTEVGSNILPPELCESVWTLVKIDHAQERAKRTAENHMAHKKAEEKKRERKRSRS